MTVTNSTKSFFTAKSYVSNTTYSSDNISPLINLNGKLYELKVYHKKPDADWEEITDSYLKLAKGIDFQEIIQQIKVPYKKIEIQTSIYPNTNSICNIQDTDGTTRKIAGFSLTKSQNAKIFQILKKINLSREVSQNKAAIKSSSLSKESLENLNSLIKVSLAEIKEERTRDYLEQVNKKYKNINPELSYSENSNGIRPFDNERAIGLDRQGNNCCINAALQIILNNLDLRELWKQRFKEPAEMYYKALDAGDSSAPKRVTQRFRELLAEKSCLVKKTSIQQEASYVLEAFFDVCQKDGLDLSSAMLHFEREKYNSIDGVRKLDRIDIRETCLMPIIVEQSTSETKLEELIKKNCFFITEAEGKKFESITRYTTLPSSLIVHFSHYRKDALDILIPMHFIFPKEHVKDSSIHEYELEGFIVHLGQNHESGHYIAFRKVNGQWKKFNDGRVTDVDEKQLQQALLADSQREKSSGFFPRLRSLKQSVLGASQENPYPCVLSYSKKSSL